MSDTVSDTIYVVTIGIIRNDRFGMNTVVATEPGKIDQAPTLQKYMTSLGLTPSEWMRDNCRLIASHTNTTVKHVLIDPVTRLEDNIRVYKPERLWQGEPTKQLVVVDYKDGTHNTVNTGPSFLLLMLVGMAIIATLFFASLLG